VARGLRALSTTRGGFEPVPDFVRNRIARRWFIHMVFTPVARKHMKINANKAVESFSEKPFFV
jgi:hypothetical protein